MKIIRLFDLKHFWHIQMQSTPQLPRSPPKNTIFLTEINYSESAASTNNNYTMNKKFSAQIQRPTTIDQSYLACHPQILSRV